MAKKKNEEIGVAKTGRPSKYSEDLAKLICERIATSDKGLNAICKEGGMPSPSSIYLWLNDHKEFSEMYARAREAQADYMVEQIISIADDDGGDLIQGLQGSYPNGVNVQRSRLKSDVRKWAAAKLAPKKYGDKLDIDHTVHREQPLLPD